jgi:uncharacterized membrane protein YoaK (UPF0700 family)
MKFVKESECMKNSSESYLVAALLSVTGGFLDAYTFISRDGVFANAQTGNFARLAIYLAEGNWERVLRYFIPIFFFVIGVSVAMWISRRACASRFLCWQHYTILLEIALLFAASWVPYGKTSNIYANLLVSFTCAIQAESFRKVLGTPFASTMCTGNLRNASEYLNQFFVEKEKGFLKKSIQYFGIDVLFVIGAVIGTVITKALQIRATLCCCVMLGAVFLVIPRKEKVSYRNTSCVQ